MYLPGPVAAALFYRMLIIATIEVRSKRSLVSPAIGGSVVETNRNKPDVVAFVDSTAYP
jgi:hypothetical protein